jgi:predicted dehydrogenase
MSSRIESLSAAVVGTGFIGPVHVEGLRRAGVQVTGIVGSSPERSRAAAERLGLPRGYESFDELLRDDSVGGHNEGFPDTFKQFFRSFYGYIAADDFSAPPPFLTFADGHREILLCEAVLRSHRERRWVSIEESC